MTTMFLYAFQFAGPFTAGLIITRYLRAVTVRVPGDLCGTHDRVEFWVRVCAVLTVCMPLALVLIASVSTLSCPGGEAICEDHVVRQTSVFTLTGALLSVGVVACTIGRSIPRAQKSIAPPSPEAAAEAT